MANTNTQTTINTAQMGADGKPVTGVNKAFYDRKMLETAKTRLVHASFGQKRSIPEHNGKRVEFRRWDLFDPNDARTPLQEGVTPDGQSLSQTLVEAEVEQYGAYVEVSDLLETTGFDETMSDTAGLLGEQIGTVVEWVTRDAMNAGNNVQRAGGKVDRIALTPQDKLTVDEIRKAVRTLKKAKARMFTLSEAGARKPHYICICSPEATYDLQSDPLWQDVSKYSNAEQIYTGEIGRLFGVVFVESTEAKVFKPAVVNAVAAATSASNTFVLQNAPAEGEAEYLKKGGNVLYIDGVAHTLAESDPFDAETNTVTLASSATLTEGAVVCSGDAGAIDADTKVASPVHATLVFGADAYGVIDVSGKGTLRSIIKYPGSGGTADPLDQRGTVGVKVMAYAAKILNDLWLVRIEHGVSC